VAYRLEPEDGSLPEGLRRIALEQVDGALTALDQAGPRPDWAVHDVRKRCKRLRGLVRLVRPRFGEWRTEDKWFRDTARPLAELRDREVFFRTFDALFEMGAPQPETKALLSRAIDAERDVDNKAACLDTVRNRLVAARGRVPGWQLEKPGWSGARGGFLRTYRKARKAMRRATREPTGAYHHAWRKHAELHWFHTRLLLALWPAMADRAVPADELSDVLGKHHDLFVFEEWIGALLPADSAALESLAKLAASKRATLERQAHRLGAELFADPVDDWRRRCSAEMQIP